MNRPPIHKLNEVDAEFFDFHEQHPRIYREFKKIAMALRFPRKLFGKPPPGRKHYGAKAVMEVIRYHRAISGGDDFKVNNNHTSRYARMLERDEPTMKGFFHKRFIDSLAFPCKDLAANEGPSYAQQANDAFDEHFGVNFTGP